MNETMKTVGQYAESILREVQREMTNEARVDLWRRLQQGYCQYCGRDEPICYCTNAE